MRKMENNNKKSTIFYKFMNPSFHLNFFRKNKKLYTCFVGCRLVYGNKYLVKGFAYIMHSGRLIIFQIHYVVMRAVCEERKRLL